ncbi:hypothetical protein BD626DRAFT_538342 [Schizophyllum amplum]|uniref:Uncharacterized protein n=1 Tax=Schizophyllum amplum TaxID=97359 RepID=A0A550C8F2_9AGAR|nr:hypothetical protein BD626DRAFT_538342 [Auriculariopsis ampla]
MADEEFSQMLAVDMAERLAKTMKENPAMSQADALARVHRDMLRNNPFVPPEGCPVNVLPNELLAYIFSTGVKLQQEEDEAESDDEEDDNEELLMQDDGDDEWEDEDDRPSRSKTKKPAQKDDKKEEKEGDASTDEEEEDEDDEEGLVMPFQVLVSHVCQRWRTVALDTPDLWTVVYFAEPAPFEKSRAYVERSKNRPLDIILNLNNHEHSDDEDAIDGDAVAEIGQDIGVIIRPRDSADPEAEDATTYPCPSNTSKDEVKQILDVIIPHIERWRHFELETDSYDYIYDLLGRLSRAPAAPELEVFQIYHYENCEDYDTFRPAELGTPFCIFGGSAPKLEMLALWGVHINWEECVSMFAGLKDLELAYHATDVRPSFETFIEMISTSPNLKTLALSLSGPSGEPEKWPTDVVELPSVLELIISDHDKAFISQLMHILSFPNVKHLVVDGNNEDFTEFALQLAAPMPNCSHSILAGLETLKIGGLPCDENAAEVVLSQLGGLREFKIKCPDGPDETEGIFFQLLQRPRTGAAQGEESKGAFFCPRLEKLATQGIDGHAMKNLVQARRAAGVPLKHVSFSDDDDVDILDETWLRENVETLDFYEPSDDDSEYTDDEEASDVEMVGDEILTLPHGVVVHLS